MIVAFGWGQKAIKRRRRMKMRRVHFTVVIIIVLLVCCLVKADAPLITELGNGYNYNVPESITLGNLFTVADKSITINSLGMYDDGAAGLNQSHSVGLWTNSGTLLARADFSPGLDGFEINGFIYKNLGNPVVLQAGVSYVLAASYQNNSTDGVYINSSTKYETWSSVVTYNGIARQSSRGVDFTFPPYQIYGQSYVSSNALYTPEPTTLLLFTLGGLALRRKRGK
jgi:hypothetical protein